MDTQYYNLIPPLAKSEDFGPASPGGGSDDSGVQDEQPQQQPQRPPRSIDGPATTLPKHSYINLMASNSAPRTPPPPTLPKRQPYLVQSPTLTHRNISSVALQRSSSAITVQQHKKLNSKRGICKCKAGKTNEVYNDWLILTTLKNCRRLIV